MVVLEAPGGYGKSTFAEQLTANATSRVHVRLGPDDTSVERFAARLRDACRGAGLVVAAEIGASDAPATTRVTEMNAAITRASPADSMAVIIEDAHHLEVRAQTILTTFAVGERAGTRFVVTARALSIEIPGEHRIGANDLAFSAGETQELLTGLGDDSLDAEEWARSIAQESGGWPAMIGLAATMRSRGVDLDNVPLQIDALVDRLVGQDTALDKRAQILLGFLPVLSVEIGEAVGMPNLVADALAAGLPVRRAGEWWRLSDSVRDHLRRRGRVDPDDAVHAAELMFAAGEVTGALDMVMAVSRPADACRLIGTMPYSALDELDVDGVTALLDAVPDTVVKQFPRCLAQVARAAESRVRIELRTRLLDRLETITEALADSALAREIEAERVCDFARDSLIEIAETRGRALLSVTPAGEQITRARCLRAVGRATAWRGDPRSLIDASHLLAEAAGAARALGNDIWVADALCTLGYSVHFARGDFERAVATQSEGIALLGRRSRQRAVQLTFLANVLATIGRDEEALSALADARIIGRAHGDERILGYAAWEQARVVSRSRDAATTLRWLRETERHPGDWLDHPTGTQFLSEAAEVAAVVGEYDLARDYLERAARQAVAQGWPEIPEVAAGIVAARIGDPDYAEAVLGAPRSDNYLNESNSWRITLLRANARWRAGDELAAHALADSAAETLESLGYPELAMLHEPEIWSRLRAGPALPTASVSVSVLGGFAVSVDGRLVELPNGRPSQVVKLLAVAGRAMPLDELADAMWPDTDTEVGRRRLRNVLTRVRSAAPVLDRTGGAIALAPGTDVDARRFEQLAQSAVANTTSERLEALCSAAAAYTGELLPSDRFDEWTVAPRERLQRRAVRVLALLAAEYVERGDPDGVITTAEAKLAIDPFDDALALSTAKVLQRAGRAAESAHWMSRARAIRDELGLPSLD